MKLSENSVINITFLLLGLLMIYFNYMGLFLLLYIQGAPGTCYFGNLSSF